MRREAHVTIRLVSDYLLCTFLSARPVTTRMFMIQIERNCL